MQEQRQVSGKIGEEMNECITNVSNTGDEIKLHNDLRLGYLHKILGDEAKRINCDTIQTTARNLRRLVVYY